ncbi:MAG: hypothetical protein GC166_11110 [Alphaproteobacteria bacterium]|nr:hypothetical protein [Alphaproteobacteria bacterium]
MAIRVAIRHHVASAICQGQGDMEPKRSATPLNIALLALAGGIVVAVYFAPLLFGPLPFGGKAALVALAALTAPMHWGLMHEAIHAKLFASSGVNLMVGRLLGISIGLSFDSMRFGHLMHHRANRHSFDRPEDYPEGKSWFVAAIGYYFTLLGGGTLKASLTPLPVLLPSTGTRWAIRRLMAGEDSANVKQAALRTFTDPSRRRRMRTDFLATLSLMSLAVMAWGRGWPVFALCILARWTVLSLLDNAPHYGTARDAGNAAHNTRLPPLLSWLVLNGNYHGVHHEVAELGWQDLPAAFHHLDAHFAGRWLPTLLRQFRGPVRIADTGAAGT